MSGSTLYDKIWNAHVVAERDDGMTLLYIDRHLLHEVTSPQAFDGLRAAARPPWRLGANLATPDHNVPTSPAERAAGVAGIADATSRLQVQTLDANCEDFGIEEFAINDPRQGIVHVVGPEQGATLPGMTIVCGDSHTSTHGAFAALAQGIGTSEVEHVLATQCLALRKSRNMRIFLDGALPAGVFSKDLALAVIGAVGTAGGTGHVIEFAGEAIRALSMEGRMTVCNLAVEAGARAGLVAVDDVTLDYVSGRPLAPSGAAWDAAQASWRSLRSDADAVFDKEARLDADSIAPQVTWGTSPEMVADIGATVPNPDDADGAVRANAVAAALQYMGLKAGQPLAGTPIDKVFIGSCTNARIEDLRVAAAIARGGRARAKTLVVPGSGLVKRQAEAEGLHEIFLAAGFEWREPGCSMCLGMNDDRLQAGERCASTSNRNFEGRQGHGGRTHLVSPATAAASALAGCLADPREQL